MRAKLSELQVLEMIESSEPDAVLAERYRVTTSMVSMIRNGKRHSALTGIPLTTYYTKVAPAHRAAILISKATAKAISEALGLSIYAVNRVRAAERRRLRELDR